MNFAYDHLGRRYTVELQPGSSGYTILVDGLSVTASDTIVAKSGRDVYVHLDGRTYILRRIASKSSATSVGAGSGILRAPMPGQVRQLLVTGGQQVAAGEVLMILEAMKMEIRIQAPQAAKVARIAISQGQSVEREQTLVELESDAG